VIDDNPTVHDAFDEILRRGPTNTQLEAEEAFMFGTPGTPPVAKPACQIDQALSGAEGVEKVRQMVAATPYQVAFVDIRMPGMDGVETIERVWALDSSGRIFSIHASPCGWLLCKDQVGEPLRTGGVVMKTLLESAHGAAPFACAALINPVLGQADGQPAEAGQDHRRIGLTHPAAVLLQADVQGMMQPALNDPIEPFVL
jgi:CheY-like chemotaxis protein